jgi:hypothetical protein
LLVFAGAPDPEAVAAAVRAGAHHVLVVADRTVPSWAARTVELGPLTRWESVRQLREAATMVDPATADGIAAALDDRPALLAEVARYLLREQIDPELCLRLLGLPPAARTPAPPAATRPAAAVATATATAGEAARAPRHVHASDDAVAGNADAATGSATDRESGGDDRASREFAAAKTPPRGRGRRRVSDRDVDTLLGELIAVDCVADPVRAGAWLAALADILGRQPSLPAEDAPDADLRVSMMALLEEAASQPSPAMLDALARSLEVTDPADPAVGRFRQVADQLGTRWGTPRGRGGIAPLPRLPHRAPTAGAAPDTTGVDAGPPSYFFFTSYARRGDREDVARFHGALQEELGRKVRRAVNHAGFLDRLSMDGGAHWHAELRRAVRTAPIMIALLSDDYFDSDWCGREFAVFQERIHRATPPDGLPPRCLIPVPWLRRQDSVPPSAAHIQELAIPGAGRDGMPLVDLMRERPKQFLSFLIRLADQIVEQARTPLPPLDDDTATRLRPTFGTQP